jgi:hypothetical protein
MPLSLTLGGTAIRTNPDGLVSLNDIFQAAQAEGMAEGKLDPRAWSQKPREKKSGSSGKVSVSGGPGWDFIETAAGILNVDAAHIYKTARGKGGGTARIAAFLASLYNGSRVKVDLSGIFALDMEHFAHVQNVIRLCYESGREPHSFFKKGNDIFERIIADYGLEKRRRKVI